MSQATLRKLTRPSFLLVSKVANVHYWDGLEFFKKILACTYLAYMQFVPNFKTKLTKTGFSAHGSDYMLYLVPCVYISQQTVQRMREWRSLEARTQDTKMMQIHPRWWHSGLLFVKKILLMEKQLIVTPEERENEKWEQNVTWTLAILVTWFVILCCVPIFQFPIPRFPFLVLVTLELIVRGN